MKPVRRFTKSSGNLTHKLLSGNILVVLWPATLTEEWTTLQGFTTFDLLDADQIQLKIVSGKLSFKNLALVRVTNDSRTALGGFK